MDAAVGGARRRYCLGQMPVLGKTGRYGASMTELVLRHETGCIDLSDWIGVRIVCRTMTKALGGDAVQRM